MENILKPARYINSEWNAAHKEWDSAALKVALVFPDIYEIGMSHLGTKILYGILNREKGVVCERVFAPWLDMEKKLRAEGKKLSSLESSRELKDFDIVGFSLQHEMNYADALNALELGGLALYSKERGDNGPIVIAGGPCAFNPEPLADFIDAFVIGEAEESILEIVNAVKDRGSKSDILKKLAEIDGVYVPDLSGSRLGLRVQPQCPLEQYSSSGHESASQEQSREDENASLHGHCKIKKRVVKDLDKSFFPTDIIVPYIQIVHDRIGIEIMRGCPHACKFCQARKIFHPIRIRSVKRIMEIAEESVKSTGYEEISLLSLSSGDYPHIEELAGKLEERFKPMGVKISLPSLRTGTFEEHEGMATLRRAGLTFAPEAGSERLRHSLNKKISDAEIIEKSRTALKSGWRKVKLYFMIGLPGETPEDLDAIARLAGQIKNANLSVSPFIPKPRSDFEREGMDGLETLKEKQRRLFSAFKSHPSAKNIRTDFHSAEMARVEAVLARGDRSVGGAILKAQANGARLQAWTENFNYTLWDKAFQETGIDPEKYLKKKEDAEILPWGFIE
ncbi:MAG: TIGR03960 family B12-binding radical SAM protein [Candidatus Omnitrophota bacterium]|nr:TIGR03960 family B12-binding radical SAM protein [Candidatus Omnitrophota bacterium]